MAKAVKRSPVYPAFGLEKAIAKAIEMYETFGESWTSIDAIADGLKLSEKSSGFLQMISALKQFDLLTDQGSRGLREFKLTGTALDILLHEEGSEEHRRALARAAQSPSLHAELLSRFDGKLPPSDAPLRAYLLRQREDATFNPATVDAFLRQFRDSLSFAQIDVSGKMIEGGRREAGEPSASTSASTAAESPMVALNPSQPTSTSRPAAQGSAGSPVFSLMLPGENRVTLLIDRKMSADDYSTLKMIFEMMRASMVEEPKRIEEPAPQPLLPVFKSGVPERRQVDPLED